MKGEKTVKNAFKKLCDHVKADHVILTLGVLLLVFYASLEVLVQILPTYQINPLIRVLILFTICVVFYCGGALRLQRTGDSATFRRLFYFFFALYLYLILTVTLTDVTLGRDGDFIFNDIHFRDQRAHYVKWFVNLIPFRSIYEVYILGLVNGYVNFYYVLLNLIGNLCLFMPFAFFMPLLFRRQRKWYFFVPTVILCIAAVEALQFLFMIGSCDIDDLILNATGAITLYFLIKIPCLKRLCMRFLRNSFE